MAWAPGGTRARGGGGGGDARRPGCGSVLRRPVNDAGVSLLHASSVGRVDNLVGALNERQINILTDIIAHQRNRIE